MPQIYNVGPETPWKYKDSSGRTVYTVTSPTSEGGLGTYGATVQVSRPVTHYDYEDQGSLTGPHDRSLDLNRFASGDGPHGQGALFGVRHIHPHVSWMSASRQFGSYIPSLLSIAATETKARYGEGLRSDTSLSSTSAPIVQRLAESGSVAMPKNWHQNNRVPDDRPHYATRLLKKETAQEIPEETVRISRQFLREALRRPRQPVSEQSSGSGPKAHKQQTLFGEDR